MTLADKLRREVFDHREGQDAFDAGYRKGWTDRGRALLRDMGRVELGLLELMYAPAVDMRGVVEIDFSELEDAP